MTQDYHDLQPHPFNPGRKGYYEHLDREDLVRACERKDRNIARLDAALITMEQRWHLAESRTARLERQISRVWLLTERELAQRESDDDEPQSE